MSTVGSMDNFIAGFAYGMTTVAVGQPLDTIKTRMQAVDKSTAIDTGLSIFKKEGIAGLYRGGLVLVLGASLIRSAQFGVYEVVLSAQRNAFGHTLKEERALGIFDIQVVVAGFAGGVGRGVVEGPFELIKTRRQVHGKWGVKEVFTGSGATMFRNSFLFSSFVVYMDLAAQLTPSGGSLGPFWLAGICSSLAWLTVWPVDVVKSQVQSGRYGGQSIPALVRRNLASGVFYRGLVPGLARSFVANGLSMVVYQRVLALLKDAEQ